MRRGVLKPHAPLFEWPVRVIDLLIVALAGLLAYWLYLDAWPPPEHYVFAMIGMSILCSFLFVLLGLYAPQRGVTLFEEVRGLANAWLLLAAAWFALLFLTKSGIEFSRAWSIYWLGFGYAGHLAFRGSLRLALRALRRRGYNQRHIAIVGAGALGREIAERLRQMPGSGFVVHGFYDDDPRLVGKSFDGIAVLGKVDRVLQDLDSVSLDQVWIALPLRAEAKIRLLVDGLRQHSVQVRFVPDIFGFALLRQSTQEIAGLPVISLAESPLEGVNQVTKTIEDVVLALVILAVAAPAMLLIALGVKLSSPGPVLYRQQRVTWNGKRFQMLKFRTMPVGVEQETQAVWAKPGEPRATPFGAFLRRFSLDELPQFLNVLRGEMSIVGPRPERPEFVQRFRREIPGYMQKHLVKAGITGWAQVNDLRGDTDLRERIRYDLYYIENWSPWFDLRIILLTVLHVFRTRNAY
jgi:putative colanic acid biosynthesis UDP-glucose lipid carrier transferase